MLYKFRVHHVIYACPTHSTSWHVQRKCLSEYLETQDCRCCFSSLLSVSMEEFFLAFLGTFLCFFKSLPQPISSHKLREKKHQNTFVEIPFDTCRLLLVLSSHLMSSRKCQFTVKGKDQCFCTSKGRAWETWLPPRQSSLMWLMLCDWCVSDLVYH